MSRQNLSSMRKRLGELVRQRAACERIAMGTGPMVAASFLERIMRPGQPGPYYYLSASVDGESRHRYVPLAEAHIWRRRAERWREFSHAMARWVKLNREIEALLRSMGRERCVPLPRASARKSSQRRGRTKR